MANVVHELIANLDAGTYTVHPPINVRQGDSNAHVILFKLRDSQDNPIQISVNAKPVISFQKVNETKVLSYAVNVVSAYNGELSYVIGPALVDDFGVFTVTLYVDTSEGCDSSSPRVVFVANIIKSECYDPSAIEVTITKKFRDEIEDHLSNGLIHVGIDDRRFLNTFIPLSQDLYELLSEGLDKKIEEMIVEEAGFLLRRAFITVDVKSQMTGMPDDQLCDGKLFRINYPNHDGDPSTIDPKSEEPDPEYWVALYHGTPDDGGFYEFHQVDFGGGGGGIPSIEGEGAVDIQIVDDAAVVSIKLDNTGNVLLSQTTDGLKASVDLSGYQSTSDKVTEVDSESTDAEYPSAGAVYRTSQAILQSVNQMLEGLATVARTGSYNDLLDKPTIPAAQVNSDWNATEGVAKILNKPTIPEDTDFIDSEDLDDMLEEIGLDPHPEYVRLHDGDTVVLNEVLTEDDINFDFDFTTGIEGGTPSNFVSIYVSDAGDLEHQRLRYKINDEESIGIYSYQEQIWSDPGYRTLVVVGDQTISDTDAISWLNDNAEVIPAV